MDCRHDDCGVPIPAEMNDARPAMSTAVCAVSPIIAHRGRGYQLLRGDAGYRRLGALPYAAVHVLALGWIWTGVDARAAACFAVLYVARVLGVTVAYHRYFSHRAFQTSRAFQFMLALLAECTAQKGVLWYASHHRYHHRHADTELDLHSPVRRGFFYAHVGWIFDSTDDTDLARVRDLARYPELRFIDRFWLLPPLALALGVLAVGGWSALFFGFFLNTGVTWHLTYTVNSICHAYGSRRVATPDESRNNALIGLLMFGEGWHNNHHACMRSVRLGLRWWEIDVGYYVIRALAWAGLVWRLREPPPRLRAPLTARAGGSPR
jgi:stearoyl-CoA desaturase (delta-9 desaturase)